MQLSLTIPAYVIPWILTAGVFGACFAVGIYDEKTSTGFDGGWLTALSFMLSLLAVAVIWCVYFAIAAHYKG